MLGLGWIPDNGYLINVILSRLSGQMADNQAFNKIMAMLKKDFSVIYCAVYSGQYPISNQMFKTAGQTDNRSNPSEHCLTFNEYTIDIFNNLSSMNLGPLFFIQAC